MNQKQRDIEAWNQAVPVDTEVLYSSKGDFTETTPHRTRSEAYLADSGIPVIFLKGKAGYVSLYHVIPADYDTAAALNHAIHIDRVPRLPTRGKHWN